LVGTEEDLYAAVATITDAIELELERIGPYAPAGGVERLTDRQREAITAAVAAGYYETPRHAGRHR
jgi:predicted DNA binding protein